MLYLSSVSYSCGNTTLLLNLGTKIQIQSQKIQVYNNFKIKTILKLLKILTNKLSIKTES